VQKRVAEVKNFIYFNTFRMAWAIFAFWASLQPLPDAMASRCGLRLAKKITSHQSGSTLSFDALAKPYLQHR